MRLMAQAKMGYYPTPSPVVSLVAEILRRKSKGNIRLIDPCAGKGTALNELGQALNAETYGIELDKERGSIAKEILTQCLITDYQSTRISNHAFSLLYLNPPYDWALKQDEISKSARYERIFLRNTVRLLIPNGILVFLIPQARLDKTIAKIISYRFQDVRVFKFPEDEYQAFKQIVLFGVLKKQATDDDELSGYLTGVGKLNAIVPSLERGDCLYEVHDSPERKNFIFRSTSIDIEELETEIREQGLYEQIDSLVRPLTLSERIKPIMPLRQGHLAQLLACGMMSGVIFDKDEQNPLVVKGITRKVVDERTEYEDGKQKIIETDRIIITINTINPDGEFVTLT